MIQFLFALVAGLVTIGGPCILPLLPIVLGTSTVARHRLRPLAIVCGFIVTFTAFALVFSLFGSLLGLSPIFWRNLSTIVIGLFGVMMLFPKLQTTIFARLEPLVANVSRFGSTVLSSTPRSLRLEESSPSKDTLHGSTDGLASGFILGLTLGAVWTPCAGPILGSILTLIAAKQNLAQAGGLLVAFSIGAAIPMLIIAYGGQIAVQKVRALSKYAGIIQRVFGALVILVAIGIATGADTAVQTYLLERHPQLFFGQNIERAFTSSSFSSTPLPSPMSHPSSLPVLANQMPPYVSISKWWNLPDGQPLTPESLKGKVVLVDFWTYSCINCIRTQPVLKAWWKQYAGQGLVIVGVHTPEFAFEKDPANVEAAIKKAGLEFPIALDPDYGMWNAYQNQYWPAEYFFDRQGRLRHTHFGEGEYAASEDVIRQLLAEGGSRITETPTGVDTSPKFNMIKTPETYFGYSHLEQGGEVGETTEGGSFANERELKKDQAQNYLIQNPKANQWSIGGSWWIDAEKATAQTAGDQFQMNVDTNAMYLVLGPSGSSARIHVTVDGKETQTFTVDRKQLYTIAQFPSGGRHTVGVTVLDPGVEFYAATFGE